MSDTNILGFPEAARRLGVTLRVLRRAIRSGAIPAPAQANATASLPAAWVQSVEAAVTQSPKVLSGAKAQKVAPFARYKGTSAWRKYKRRVHEYARFQAASGHSGAV